MDKTLRQRFRQPFGFYMENLIGRHFNLNGIFTMYHAHSHAFEWGLDLDGEDLNQLNSLICILYGNTGPLKKRVLEILRDKIGFPDKSYAQLIRNAFSSNDSEELFYKKIILLAVSNLVSSNTVELLKIQNHKLIVSEVKSQYGPIVNHRIEIDRSQLENLFRLTNNGIDSSLLYCIALPEPAFIEIPFKALYENFQKYPDFNGKEFTDKDWSHHRMRIPKEYRDANKFIKIDRSLYNFNDETSLFKSILNAFPGKFIHLEKLIL